MIAGNVGAVHIRTRKTRSGPRYQVRYRLGGRGFPLVHAGSFKTMKEARGRRDFVAGEIAAGRDPAAALSLLRRAKPARTFAQWADAYHDSRVDLAGETTKNLRSHLLRILPTFGRLDPRAIAPDDVQAWIAAQADELRPSSLKRYFTTLRMILDYTGVEPNPARHGRLKLPRIEHDVPAPPSASQVAAILSALPMRWRLPLRLLEQTGMRVGELEALEWRDVDAFGSRFRIRSGKTAAARRLVAVPDWLMRDVLATTPPDDREPGRRVFPRFTANVARNAMGRACRAVGVPHFHPHDLRHRWASVQLAAGVPRANVAEQGGWRRISTMHDVYEHVLVEGDE
jgi:integrase